MASSFLVVATEERNGRRLVIVEPAGGCSGRAGWRHADQNGLRSDSWYAARAESSVIEEPCDLAIADSAGGIEAAASWGDCRGAARAQAWAAAARWMGDYCDW